MLPTYFSPCPIQTQANHLFRATTRSLYLQFKLPIRISPFDPSPQFFVQLGRAIEHPQFTRVIPNDQIQLFNFGWVDRVITNLWYYGLPPLLGFTTADLITPHWWPVPYYHYQRPRPLMPVAFSQSGIQLFIDLDRDTPKGSTDTTDWLVSRGPLDFEPISVSFAGNRITLTHIQFLFGPISNLQYTLGSTPFVADNRGELQTFDIPAPYPA